MKHIVAVSTNTYHGFTLEEALKGISAAGFKYVELTAVAGWTEHVKANMTDAELEDVKKMLKKYNLKPIGLSGHCDLMDAKRLEDFSANIELAGKLGCKFIISSTGEAHNATKEYSQDDLLVENLKKVLPLCEKLGIKLVLETHGEHATGALMSKLVDKVGSKYLGINYDTANVMFYGKKLPEEDIKECAKNVAYVHLKDKGGEKDVWDFPAPGKGWLKLKETLEYLDSQGFDGPISTEIEFTEGFTMRDKKPEDLPVVDTAVKDAYDFYKKNGFV
ncbi:MAG: sugar phosphate isomerase/epimerase family protein [Sphaerochaetaceae bacterium]|jgi:sugar phosphate isomerase/epimerase|nr:sugar phosphate isomerase/epimerase [Sphaerochaetaceae bacterium]MDD4219838.1 sugar phosphate isomerase/epimerase [Sphaerochaetaceae bacterium]